MTIIARAFFEDLTTSCTDMDHDIELEEKVAMVEVVATSTLRLIQAQRRAMNPGDLAATTGGVSITPPSRAALPGEGDAFKRRPASAFGRRGAGAHAANASRTGNDSRDLAILPQWVLVAGKFVLFY